MFTSLKYVAAPNIEAGRPMATGLEKAENPKKLGFFQNGGENYFRFRFSLQIRVLRVQLSRKRHKYRRGTLKNFRVIGGLKFRAAE